MWRRRRRRKKRYETCFCFSPRKALNRIQFWTSVALIIVFLFRVFIVATSKTTANCEPSVRLYPRRRRWASNMGSAARMKKTLLSSAHVYGAPCTSLRSSRCPPRAWWWRHRPGRCRRGEKYRTMAGWDAWLGLVWLPTCVSATVLHTFIRTYVSVLRWTDQRSHARRPRDTGEPPPKAGLRSVARLWKCLKWVRCEFGGRRTRFNLVDSTQKGTTSHMQQTQIPPKCNEKQR